MKRTLATILGIAAVLAVACVRAVDIPQIDGETRAKIPGYISGKGFITNGQAGVSVSGLTNTGGFFLGGAGTIGTNGSTSSLTVNMPTTFTALTNAFGTTATNTLVLTTNWNVATSGNSIKGGYILSLGTNSGRAAIIFGLDGGIAIGKSGQNAMTEFPNNITKPFFGAGLEVPNCLDMPAGAAAAISANGYSVSGGSTVKRTRTATSAGAIWPSLSVIGEASTNLVNISGCVTNTSHILVSVFPVETGVIYKAGVFTNGTAIVIREALVAVDGATNFVRVTDFGF